MGAALGAVSVAAQPAQLALDQIQLAAQQVKLGPQIAVDHLAGDQRQMRQLHGAGGRLPPLGGSAGREASLAQILGPSFAQDEMADVIDKLIKVYVEQRTEEESFLDTFRRVGIDPFKERVYAANH